MKNFCEPHSSLISSMHECQIPSQFKVSRLTKRIKSFCKVPLLLTYLPTWCKGYFNISPEERLHQSIFQKNLKKNLLHTHQPCSDRLKKRKIVQLLSTLIENVPTYSLWLVKWLCEETHILEDLGSNPSIAMDCFSH